MYSGKPHETRQKLVRGGSLDADLITTGCCAQYLSNSRGLLDLTYLLNAVKSYASMEFRVYAASRLLLRCLTVNTNIQNQPENSDTTYGSATMTAAVEVGMASRTLLDHNGVETCIF